jgi:hypothetical protein
MLFGWQRLSIMDRLIVGGAAVAFIAGFLPWWGAVASLDVFNVDGWSSGFTAWAGVLFLTAAGALVVLRRSSVSWPSTAARLVAAMSALGLLLVFIRWLTLPRHRGDFAILGESPRYGVYVALIAGIIEVAAAAAEVRGSDKSVVGGKPANSGV